MINNPRCNYVCLKPRSGSADVFLEEGFQGDTLLFNK